MTQHYSLRLSSKIVNATSEVPLRAHFLSKHFKFPLDVLRKDTLIIVIALISGAVEAVQNKIYNLLTCESKSAYAAHP